MADKTNSLKHATHIATFFFLLLSSINAIDPTEQSQGLAKAQLSSVGSLPAKIDAIGLEFSASKEALRYGRYEYCSSKYRTDSDTPTAPWPDSACDGKSTSTRIEESAVPVKYIAWGFVLEGDEADKTYNDIYGISPGTNAFTLINNNSGTFGDHLCIEVHFKDTSQLKNVSLSLNNKTIVLCANSSDASTELVDIDMIDSDNDGLNNPTHSVIPSGPSGWRCYNPHNSLGNGGLGMGYIELNGNPFKLISSVGNIFDNCFPAMESVDN
ncbi:MAG: hypothetical protein CMF46_00360 [Legionellales bacterium]|nr:hypothetical protein [Legionellales bacterium]|tara:strand:- start:470 stop:1276 length:807 start_codon:yes stop_codon:yes gene_type:complete